MGLSGGTIMGFTIEDMLTISRDKYSMKLVAGEKGWSNSISWLIMMEELTITKNFSGKELAVTTGLGFKDMTKLKELIDVLIKSNSSGLIINTGCYIYDIPEDIKKICDENDFPLLTVPWDVYLVDMIKDISIRVFLQGSTDEQISNALIKAIEFPSAVDTYRNDLLQYFDTDGTFQIFLLTTGNLDSMDTVERKRLAYRLQLYINNITHNGHFFYYDSYFVIVMNAVEKPIAKDIITEFVQKAERRMPENKVFIGVGSQVTDISNLHIAYKRAKSAAIMAEKCKREIVRFDDMGIFRILMSVEDKQLLKEISEELLSPLIERDKDRNSNYIETLDSYLRNDGSIQAVSAEMFTHRNTVIYRIKNIKSILNTNFDTLDEKMQYHIACLIWKNRD